MFKNIKNICQNILKSIFLFEKVVYLCINKMKQKLLKLKEKSLPKLSDMVGKDIRSNNEALIYVVSPDKTKDFSKGVAIGSILDVDKNTHIEICRYGKGSGFWRALLMPTINEKNFFLRLIKLFIEPLKNPIQWFKVFTVKDFATHSSVLLFMQN